MLINLMLMPERHKVTVNVNDVFAADWNAVLGLVLLSNSFRKQPVQDAEVNVHGFEFPAVKSQVISRQAIFKVVKLDEGARAPKRFRLPQKHKLTQLVTKPTKSLTSLRRNQSREVT
jgi:hypothetical protein